MRFRSFILAIATCLGLKAQVPILDTDTASNFVVFLDFDSAYVTGTSWNTLFTSGNPINAGASRLDSAEIVETWKRIADEFSIFDLNITTDSTRFNSAAASQRMRVIFTDSSNWFSPAGGVAFLNSFAGTTDNPAWVFEDNLGPYSPRYIADAAAHEIGHTLNLYHQSVYNGSCVKIDEYNPGNGSGTTIRWAPIMGVAYYSNITTWYNGVNSNGCSTYQYDIATIMSSAGLSLLADDHGNTTTGATNLPITGTSYSTSGLITDSADVDYFKLVAPSATTISVAATPVSPTSGVNFVNLDIELQILDSLGNTLISNDSASTPLAYIGTYAIPAGTYYITVDGVGSANYGDYGSLGRYTLEITSTVSLPNHQVRLSIAKGSDYNTLKWTHTITGLEGFDIETSEDGNHWRSLAKVNSAASEYLVPSTGGFFRVTAVTKTQQRFYSNIVSFKGNLDFRIIPNPNSGSFRIETFSPKLQEVEIFNSTGKRVIKAMGSAFSLPQLQPGVYMVALGATVKKMVVY